jgi:hypothetical protein
MKIINLTQHKSTLDQQQAGVFDLEDSTELKNQLTFNSLPTLSEIQERAQAIALIAESANVKFAMIGGAGYLMPLLEQALKQKGIKPLHAFTQRVSIEKHENGQVIKENVFKHVGFVGE